MSDKSPLKIIVGCNHQFVLLFLSWLRTLKYCNVANTPTHSPTHTHKRRTVGQSPLTWNYCRYRAATQFQARRVPCLAALLLFCDICSFRWVTFDLSLIPKQTHERFIQSKPDQSLLLNYKRGIKGSGGKQRLMVFCVCASASAFARCKSSLRGQF